MASPRAAPPLPLLTIAPELGEGLTPRARSLVEASLPVAVVDVPRGRWRRPWIPETKEAAPAGGLLVLEGLVVRTLTVEGGHSAGVELLGPGDLVRPWHEDGGDLLRAVSAWDVPDHARVAVIDGEVLATAAQVPPLVAALLERGVRRARWVALMGALGRAGGARERLVLVFAHLGDRWGRVAPAGVVIELPLTHRLLASLAGMARPTCSTALSWLADQGLVWRDDEGRWWMRADAQAAVGASIAADAG